MFRCEAIIEGEDPGIGRTGERSRERAIVPGRTGGISSAMQVINRPSRFMGKLDPFAFDFILIYRLNIRAWEPAL